VRIDPVTTRWTGALFNLAKASGALDDVQRDITRIGVEVSHASVSSYLFSALVGREERRRKLSGILADFHPLTRNFVNALFDKHREEVLRDVAQAFRQRLLEERGEVEGVVESARPMDASELTQLAASLGARVGKHVILENRIAPDLVGGIRVFVGASMIDYSVQGRMDGLRRKLLDARLPAAQ